jgi:hypothetical protein
MGAIGIGALTPSSGPGGPNRTVGTNRSDWGRPGGWPENQELLPNSVSFGAAERALAIGLLVPQTEVADGPGDTENAALELWPVQA